MGFQHPFQCVKCLEQSGPPAKSFLVAAAGPRLYVLDRKTGNRLSVWPSPVVPETKGMHAKNSDSPDHGGAESSEPPEKKRKLSPTPSENGLGVAGNEEFNTKTNGPDKMQDLKLEWSTIPIVTPSKSGKHIVVVTAEDKFIRVFAVDPNGVLSQLSERCMPKRPCAVVLSPDESTILCGDKFGDVYSLPFFPRNDYKPRPKKSSQPSHPAQPSASALTVHTKRNLQALEQQLKRGATISEKIGPLFELKLLLGHVSMLTDVAYVTLCTDAESTVPRPYIITADRDEHIRVSRGPPQTHVIQSYCLGHTAFVSKLCVLPWNTSTLISGGGDDYLLVWHWAKGELVQEVRIPLDGDDMVASKGDSSDKRAENISASEVAVNGIWPVSLAENESLRNKTPGVVIVTLEGIPKLFPFTLSLDSKMVAQSPVGLSGNALGVTSLDNAGNIIVAVDNVHEPGSVKDQRKSPDSLTRLIQAFSVLEEQGTMKWTEVDTSMVNTVNGLGTFELATSEEEKEMKKLAQALTATLYSFGNLRKWGKGDDE
ncbi:hypothetical protein PABG_01431 [Paracoccidioides brasiliensis Pb03]|nr:hypothetical protein PABG_01431 [Paracoccidioides brasiliensis Pb03]